MTKLQLEVATAIKLIVAACGIGATMTWFSIFGEHVIWFIIGTIMYLFVLGLCATAWLMVDEVSE